MDDSSPSWYIGVAEAQAIDQALEKRREQEYKQTIERIKIKARMGLLPDFLPLWDIGVLEGYDPYVFESVIEDSGLVITEQCELRGAYRKDYKEHLQRIGQWPVNGLLANWWPKDEPQAEPLADAGAGRTGKKKQKGETDRLRTEHFIEWAARTNYDGSQIHYWLQDELRKDNSDLWGKNKTTFDKWLKTSEAIPARELLIRLKLAARQAV